MSKTSLSITGLQTDMTSDEVKQKLATLYKIPDKHFDSLCNSLFILKKPHVLFKQIDPAEAEVHIKRLTKIGLECSTGSGGLSLVPVAETVAVEADCPACDRPAGSGEMCQHCGVIIEKYLQQKKFDEQLQQQIASTDNSQQRMQKIREEKSKQQQDNKTKKRISRKNSNADGAAGKSDSSADASAPVADKVTVQSRQKSSKLLVGAIASVCFLVLGSGVVLYNYLNVEKQNDEITLASNIDSSLTSASTPIATVETASDSLSLIQEEKNKFIEQTIFSQHLHRKREIQNLKDQLRRLKNENLMISANSLVSGKVDPRDRLFGQQELVIIDDANTPTAARLQETHTIASSFVSDIDKIDALLNQAAVYNHLNLIDESAKVYDEINAINSGIERIEYKVLTDIAIAEHYSTIDTIENAQERYQHAKDKAIELEHPWLLDIAFGYIALSEVDQGLVLDANSTSEMIADRDIRSSLAQQIDIIVAQFALKGIPVQAAAHEEIVTDEPQPGDELTGDQMIDDLVNMTKQNQLKLKAASNLLGE